MRGKAVIWGMACALLATAILPVLAGGALAQDCTTVSVTVTSDHGTRREVCPPGGSGGSPGDEVWAFLADPSIGPGDPPGADDGGALAALLEFLSQFGESVEVCQTVFESDNGDREDSEVSVCARAEGDVPSRGGVPDIHLDECEVGGQEATDPAIWFGDGGAAACANAVVEPGGLVDVDTDDCPSDDPGDPTVYVGDESVQVCPRDVTGPLSQVLEWATPGDDDVGDPGSSVPPLPSNDEGLYSTVGDAANSTGDVDPSPGGSVPSTQVDDERCPDDMVGDTSVHVGSWTVWVCVHDPTA